MTYVATWSWGANLSCCYQRPTPNNRYNRDSGNAQNHVRHLAPPKNRAASWPRAAGITRPRSGYHPSAQRPPQRVSPVAGITLSGYHPSAQRTPAQRSGVLSVRAAAGYHPAAGYSSVRAADTHAAQRVSPAAGITRPRCGQPRSAAGITQRSGYHPSALRTAAQRVSPTHPSGYHLPTRPGITYPPVRTGNARRVECRRLGSGTRDQTFPCWTIARYRIRVASSASGERSPLVKMMCPARPSCLNRSATVVRPLFDESKYG